MKSFSAYLSTLTLIIIAFTACGSNSTSPGTQFTVNVEGNITVSDAVNLIQNKAGANPNTEQQVFIGTAIIEVQEDFNQEIGIDLVSLDVTAQTDSVGDLQLLITPQTVNQGILFKRDEFGIPFGASLLDIDTTIQIPQADPETILLGMLNFVASNSQEPSRLPLFNQIPTISFLFNNQNKEATINELIIIMTPKLIEALE